MGIALKIIDTEYLEVLKWIKSGKYKKISNIAWLYTVCVIDSVSTKYEKFFNKLVIKEAISSRAINKNLYSYTTVEKLTDRMVYFINDKSAVINAHLIANEIKKDMPYPLISVLFNRCYLRSSDEEIAARFDVSTKTIYRYFNEIEQWTNKYKKMNNYNMLKFFRDAPIFVAYAYKIQKAMKNKNRVYDTIIKNGDVILSKLLAYTWIINV